MKEIQKSIPLHYWSLVALVLLSSILIGCGKKPAEQTRAESGLGPADGQKFFKTSYQDETQFIVHETLKQLAGMAVYGKGGKAAGSRDVVIGLAERPESSFRHPVYDVDLRILGKQSRFVLKMDDVFSRQTYAAAFSEIMQLTGWNPAKRSLKDLVVPGAVAELLDGKATSIERESRAVSDLLGRDFANPALHEHAAWLMGVLVLKESSGMFFDIKAQLCQMTAHMVLADHLSTDGPSVMGRLAECFSKAGSSNESDVLKGIAAIQTDSPAVASWVAILRARATRDYRPLEAKQNPKAAERIAWFRALADALSTEMAWEKLSQPEIEGHPDYCRIANTASYSVQVGHQVLQQSLSGEFQDLVAVHRQFHGASARNPAVIGSLNDRSTGMFDSAGAPRVIGWGTWAMFHQRHLANSMVGSFLFMNKRWGVPEEAREFAKGCGEQFGKMTLFPFVLRQFATDSATYRRAVDAGFLLARNSPEIVSPCNWDWLCYRGPQNDDYHPFPIPHINEWHSHNPPPGTALDPAPRLVQPSLIERADHVAVLEELHRIAPFDIYVGECLMKNKYPAPVEFEKAAAIYGSLTEYSSVAMLGLAAQLQQKPEEYERLVAKAAALEPRRYFLLADYFRTRGDMSKSIKYAVSGYQGTSDRVSASYYAGMLVDHYLDSGNKVQAKKIADEAGEVYSERGLLVKARYHERVGEVAEALTWYEAVVERYGDAGELLLFCNRQISASKDPRLVARLQAVIDKRRPKKTEAVRLSDFTKPPTDGAMFGASSSELAKVGLKMGDVIVAVYGERVHNFAEYSALRDINPKTGLEIIVWDGARYREINAAPPGKKFGVQMQNYSSR